MTSRLIAAITLGAAVIGLAGSGWAGGKLNGSFPDASRRHHQRSNCHGVYDLLITRSKSPAGVSSAERTYARAYETNAEDRLPCPVPSDTLLAQAINREVVNEESFYQLTQYAQQNDPAAYYELGFATLMGRVPDMSKDIGFQTLRESARLGDPSANFLVGILRMQPSGLGPKDEAKAIEHFAAAAKSEHVDALFMLGLMYSDGIGTGKDPKKGLEYLKQAAERGHVHAAFSAAGFVANGIGVKRDIDLAYRLGRSLIADGEVVGAVIAASALLQRKDVKQHQDEVLHWMDFAQKHGDAKIKADMARFRPQVVGIFDRMNAPPAYTPRERRVCPQRKVCYVDRSTGARNSCHTYTDYWNDCNSTM